MRNPRLRGLAVLAAPLLLLTACGAPPATDDGSGGGGSTEGASAEDCAADPGAWGCTGPVENP